MAKRSDLMLQMAGRKMLALNQSEKGIESKSIVIHLVILKNYRYSVCRLVHPNYKMLLLYGENIFPF